MTAKLLTQIGQCLGGRPEANNGVVNTNATLKPINIPIGQLEAPKAPTSFGLAAVLDSSAAVGSTISGYAPVYDSLGNQYQATVTYSKTGTKAWSNNVSLPDALTPNTSTASGITTINQMVAQD